MAGSGDAALLLAPCGEVAPVVAVGEQGVLGGRADEPFGCGGADGEVGVGVPGRDRIVRADDDWLTRGLL